MERKYKIAFDIKGTLIKSDSEESKIMIGLLKILKNAGHTIIVWSGEDKEFVEKTIKDLGIESYVDIATSKLGFSPREAPDVAFDDNEYTFSKLLTIGV